LVAVLLLEEEEPIDGGEAQQSNDAALVGLKWIRLAR
jgi:hypothetical protein